MPQVLNLLHQQVGSKRICFWQLNSDLGSWPELTCRKIIQPRQIPTDFELKSKEKMILTLAESAVWMILNIFYYWSEAFLDRSVEYEGNWRVCQRCGNDVLRSAIFSKCADRFLIGLYECWATMNRGQQSEAEENRGGRWVCFMHHCQGHNLCGQ